MSKEVLDHDAAKLLEICLKADRARRLAWSAGDQLTYERLCAYAKELEGEAMAIEARRNGPCYQGRLPRTGPR
jgi:hypothetical protein